MRSKDAQKQLARTSLNGRAGTISMKKGIESYLGVEPPCMKLYYMAELGHGGKEHSDWLPERSEFCYTMDRSQTDFTDLCF